MNKLSTPMATEKQEQKTTVSFRVEKNGITCNYTIDEISNGYLVSINEYGYTGKEPNRKYVDKTTKTYYKENPISAIEKESKTEDKKEKGKEEPNIMEGVRYALSAIAKVKGGMKV